MFSYSSVILTFPKTNKKMKNSDSSHETSMIEKPDVVPENKQTPNHHKNLQRNYREDKNRLRKRSTGRTHSQHAGPGSWHSSDFTAGQHGTAEHWIHDNWQEMWQKAAIVTNKTLIKRTLHTTVARPFSTEPPNCSQACRDQQWPWLWSVHVSWRSSKYRKTTK